MKTILTLNSGCRLAKAAIFLVLLASAECNAQVHNGGMLHVAKNSSFHISQGNYQFGAAPATTTTNRTAPYGAISFAPAAFWVGGNASHFADGYVRRYGAGKFLLPLGGAGVYAPIEITATDASGIDAGYFRNSGASLGSTLDRTLAGISTAEYWSIRRLATSQAKITLTWSGGSDISMLTGSNLSKLTIAGWDGAKWSEIPSRTDAVSILGGSSTLVAGSITALSDIDLASFTAFTLANRSNTDCLPTVVANSNVYWTSSGWAGTPSGTPAVAAPTAASNVFLTLDYAGPSFTCGSMTINNAFSLTIGSGVTVEVLGTLVRTGTGKIIVRDGGSFIRRSSTTLGSPVVEVEKTTRDMRMYDYVYWGSPTVGDAVAAINLATAAAAGSTSGAFDLKYNYVSGTGGGWRALSATSRGAGFITRVKNQAPFSQQGILGGPIQVRFAGTESNGDVTVPVINNPASPNGGTSYNLISNPYPSPIDLDKFLIENVDIDGAAYVWTSATNAGNGNNTNTQYTAADYAVYNLAGQVNTSPISQLINGRIAVAQGFKVKSLVNSGSVTFNNCMRVGSAGANFFRQNASADRERDSYKLNITAEGAYSEILIAYLPQATMGYDRLYDAGRNSTSPTKLYSILEQDGTKLAINSRPDLSLADTVLLGMSKTGTALQEFKINITDKSGAFANGVPVFLHDKALNLYHDFANGEYSFATSEAVSDSRFEIVYENAALGNADFAAAKVFSHLKGGSFTATASLGMGAIDIYDIAGRRVFSFNAAGQKSTVRYFGYSEGVYIAKIRLENGTVATVKLVGTK